MGKQGKHNSNWPYKKSQMGLGGEKIRGMVLSRKGKQGIRQTQRKRVGKKGDPSRMMDSNDKRRCTGINFQTVRDNGSLHCPYHFV